MILFPICILPKTLGVRSNIAQVGLVACASIEDKLDKVLRKKLLIPLLSADPEASNVASTSCPNYCCFGLGCSSSSFCCCLSTLCFRLMDFVQSIFESHTLYSKLRLQFASDSFSIRHFVVDAAEDCCELLRFFIVRLKFTFLGHLLFGTILPSLPRRESHYSRSLFFAFLTFISLLLYFFFRRPSFLGWYCICRFAVLRRREITGLK